MYKVAFTIVLNGLHHLQHKDFAERMLSMFDYWVVAEGATQSRGSTQWCRQMPSVFHRDGQSIDGTVDYLIDLQRDNPKKMHVIQAPEGLWLSKDNMVRAALNHIPQHLWKDEPVWLWQVDVDEQWSPLHLEAAVAGMKQAHADVGMFDCRYMIGQHLQATRSAGICGWPRMWRWRGQYADRHEPPTFDGLTKVHKMPDIRFDHYAYYFEEDVQFKALWYGGHENVYRNWRTLNSLDESHFPMPLSVFFNPPKQVDPMAEILYVKEAL